MTIPEIIGLLGRERAVAILRVRDAAMALDAAEALRAGGIRLIEVTMTVDGALDVIAALAARYPDLPVGAGTVLGTDTARAVIDAGARFVVSPVLDRDVLDTAARAGVVGVPGCFTPTEILEGWRCGAPLVKVFPSTSLGPAYIRDVLGPFPSLRLMPTGGVTLENARQWLDAGAWSVGIGSALLPGDAVRDGDWERVTERARALTAAIA